MRLSKYAVRHPDRLQRTSCPLKILANAWDSFVAC
jgi:hypothetical protein